MAARHGESRVIAFLLCSRSLTRIALARHNNRQTPSNLPSAALGLLGGGDDVRSPVELSIDWVQALVTLVPHVVVIPLPIVCSGCGAVVLSCSITTEIPLPIRSPLLLTSCFRFRRPNLFATRACL